MPRLKVIRDIRRGNKYVVINLINIKIIKSMGFSYQYRRAITLLIYSTNRLYDSFISQLSLIVELVLKEGLHNFA